MSTCSDTSSARQRHSEGSNAIRRTPHAPTTSAGHLTTPPSVRSLVQTATNHSLSSRAQIPLPVSQPAQVKPAQVENAENAKSTTAFSRLAQKVLKAVGLFIAIFSFTSAALALAPAFRSQNISQQSLDLAKWTAWKEFLELCKNAIESGKDVSPSCEEAIKTGLPPPPHVKSGLISRAVDQYIQILYEPDSTDAFNKLISPKLRPLFLCSLAVAGVAVIFCFRFTYLQVRNLMAPLDPRSLWFSGQTSQTNEANGWVNFGEDQISVKCGSERCNNARFLSTSALFRHQENVHGMRVRHDESHLINSSSESNSITRYPIQEERGGTFAWSGGQYEGEENLRKSQTLPVNACLGHWFVPGEGILRDVIETDISIYLGHGATVCTGYREGIEGFWINAFSPPTSTMINDLRQDSMRWRSEQEARKSELASLAKTVGHVPSLLSGNSHTQIVGNFGSKAETHRPPYQTAATASSGLRGDPINGIMTGFQSTSTTYSSSYSSYSSPSTFVGFDRVHASYKQR